MGMEYLVQIYPMVTNHLPRLMSQKCLQSFIKVKRTQNIRLVALMKSEICHIQTKDAISKVAQTLQFEDVEMS